MTRSPLDPDTDAELDAAREADPSSGALDQFRKTVLDAVPGLMSYWSRDLYCRFANKPYLEWFGLPAEVVIGRRMDRVLGRRLFRLNEPYVRQALAGERQQFERTLTNAHGRIIHGLTSYIPDIVDDVVVGMVAQVTDVTLLKTAEAALRVEMGERERTHRLLRESSASLRTAQRLGQIGSWEWQADGDVIDWSEQLHRIFGQDPSCPPPPFARQAELYEPASWARLVEAVDRVMRTGQPYALELQFVRPDGRDGWVDTRGEALLDENGAVIGTRGTAQDITERVKAKQALSEKSANLEATLDNMEQGLIKVGADRGIQLFNRRFAELLDIPRTFLTGARPHFDEILNYLDQRGEFEGAPEDLKRRARDSGRPLVVGRHERVRPNGRILEVVTAPLSDGSAVSTYSDITARRQAERAVRDSEARYRMLAEATSDVIAQLDLGLVHRYLSPACRAALGHEPEELVGKAFGDLIHPEDAAGVEAVMNRLAEGSVPNDRATTTHRMRHKLGHWVWLESGVNLVRDPDIGAPRHMICSLRDVTERQRAARHLERAKNLAENAARIKADFVANMSHELRTPLTGILGVHDLLSRDPTLTPQQRRYVEMARDAGHSLLAIVNDVLDFSKIEAGQLSLEHIPFDVAQLVEACRDFARQDAQVKSLRVDARVSGAPFVLMGDPNRLRQVILNLLTNAVKFTQRGGILVDAVYDFARASLRVEVSDTGVGIPTDKIGVLFERFSQVDTSTTRRFGGSGLGLAICKSLVELMGGEIGVVSEVAQGSTFWFEIPLSPAHVGATDASERHDEPTSSPRHVLLAEDNPINQQVIVAMIEQNGHRVTVVEDGIAAVAAAQAAGFDVILLDMHMPVMDGLAAARAIRSSEASRNRRPVPIIALTANALAQDIARCREAGMDAHVAKPIDWSELFKTITRLVAAPRAMQSSPVFDKRIIADLDGYIGRDRRTKMLARFVSYIEQQMVALDSAGVSELAAMTHSLLSMSGQFGFMELSRLAAEVEEKAREGSGLDRIADLRGAGERALAAARSYLAEN